MCSVKPVVVKVHAVTLRVTSPVKIFPTTSFALAWTSSMVAVASIYERWLSTLSEEWGPTTDLDHLSLLVIVFDNGHGLLLINFETLLDTLDIVVLPSTCLTSL